MARVDGPVPSGVTVVERVLHISPEEQARRLSARLDDPRKRWRYDPGDLDARARWSDYQRHAGGLTGAATRCARPCRRSADRVNLFVLFALGLTLGIAAPLVGGPNVTY